ARAGRLLGGCRGRAAGAPVRPRARGDPAGKRGAFARGLMRVHIVDPSAFTPAYDHALCAALARAGASVELITSPFAYGSVAAPEGYLRRESFYRRLPGAAGSQLRRASKALVHTPEMLAYRRAASAADVVHFQWLDLQWLDRHLLPRRPVVLTA